MLHPSITLRVDHIDPARIYLVPDLAAVLADAGVPRTPRTIGKLAWSSPDRLPPGLKVGGTWQWRGSDVIEWLTSQGASAGQRGADATVPSPAASTPVDAVEAKLSFYRRLRIGDVTRLTGLAKQTVYDMAREGRMPAPLRDGRVSYWLAGELAAHLERQAIEYRQVQRGAQ